MMDNKETEINTLKNQVIVKAESSKSYTKIDTPIIKVKASAFTTCTGHNICKWK